MPRRCDALGHVSIPAASHGVMKTTEDDPTPPDTASCILINGTLLRISGNDHKDVPAAFRGALSIRVSVGGAASS